MDCCKRICYCCFPSTYDYEEPKAQQLVIQNPFIGASDKRCLLKHDHLEVDTKKAVNLVTQKRQLGFSYQYEPFNFESHVKAQSHDPFLHHNPNESLSEVRSFEDLSDLPCIDTCPNAFLQKSRSLTKLDTQIAVSCFLKITLYYEEMDGLLTIRLNDICNLEYKEFNTPIYVVVRIFPYFTNGFESKTVIAGNTAVINEEFKLGSMSIANLKKSSIRFTVCTKESKKHKDVVLVEGYVKGYDVNWNPQTREDLKVFLKRKWIKKMSTVIKFLESDLGELFVLLQYQSLSNRMKVLVRKANNLPKSDKLIGNPGHSVLIRLFRENELIASRETRVNGGLCPIWNQPFLFSLSNADTNNYRLEFIIKRNRRYTKDDVVGHVIIGHNAPKSGMDHWSEAMKPRGLECALWHDIMPIFTAKT